MASRGPRKRHDPFLKLLYRAGARDAITLFFPEIAARIDWGSLQWIEKEVPILSPKPRAVVADLVGQTRDVDGLGLEVLIHPELQMQTEDEMGWRVLQYNAGLTLQQANRNVHVVTIVSYHCRGAGGVREQHFGLEFHGRYPLATDYWSVGLGELDAEQYAQSENPMAWARAAWMRQPRRGRVELRLRLLAKILRFVRDEVYRRLLLDTVRTYFRLSSAEQQEEQQLLQAAAFGEVTEMLNTELGRMEERARREGVRLVRQEIEAELAQRLETARSEAERLALERMLAELPQLEERARRESERRAREQLQAELAEFEERTRREGMRMRAQQEALQMALLEIVRARFPPVPEHVETQIHSVQNAETLHELIRRAATAQTLEESNHCLGSKTRPAAHQCLLRTVEHE
jgi:hypothetical protein